MTTYFRATEHSKQRSAQRSSVPWEFWHDQITAKNYFYLGSSHHNRQVLCIKLGMMPFEVVVNEDMTVLITVCDMCRGRRQEAKKLPGFVAWLGWR